jgi:hypothetical protein
MQRTALLALNLQAGGATCTVVCCVQQATCSNHMFVVSAAATAALGGKPLAQQTCVPYSPTLRRGRRPTCAGARAGIVVGVCYLVMSCPCTYNLLRTHRCSGSPPMRSCPRNCICTVISLDCCCALCRLYVDCSLCDGLALLFK